MSSDSPSSPQTTSRCFCHQCGYDLRASADRCPECGIAFDPTDPKTFLPYPRSYVRRRWLRRILIMAAVIVLPYALGLFWLWWGWSDEQKRLAAIPPSHIQTLNTQPLYEWLPKLIPGPLEFLADRVEGIHLAPNTANDADLKVVAGLPHLYSLHVGSPQVTNAGLHHWRGHEGLRHLRLRDVSITDEGLEHMTHVPNLSSLHLDRTNVSDTALIHVRRMPALRRLTIMREPRITDSVLQHLAGMQIEYLCVADTLITDAGTVQLQAINGLKCLNLIGTAITDGCVEHLSRLHTLRQLYVADTAVTAEGIRRLKANLPQTMIGD